MKKAKITHFISPYKFYFKYDLCEKENEYIEVLEMAISAHVKEHLKIHPLAEYRFKVGDLVSLYYLPWKRCLRAQVLEVLEKFSLPTDYIVWAHDYGFPLQTGEMFLIPLPDTFKEVETLVHRGCLANVIPVNIVSEDINKPKQVKQVTEWSIQTCEELALMLDKRDIFIEIIGANNSQQFCKVDVETAGNEYVDVVDLLEGFQFAVRVDPHEFIRLHSFAFRDNFDWVNNDGTANFRINEVEDDKHCTSPLLLEDWEKQPPFDNKILEAIVEEKLEQQCLHLPSAKDPKQTSFPRFCLAHSSLLLSKRSLEQVINAEMCFEIFRMGITSYNILQRYSLPHIHRGNSLFVISPSGNGKKWCYIPVLCNILEMSAKNLMKVSGLPLSIIVTANKSKSMEIAMIINQLLQNVKVKSKDYLVTVGQVNLLEEIFQFVSILIITMEDVCKMMVNGVFKQLFYDKRLYAIVLNNITEILQYENEAFLDNLITFCKTVQETVKVDQRCIQMIVTANEWHERVCPTILNTLFYPLLLMSDFFEAAIYARCPIVTKICRNTDKKLSIIAGFIQQHQSLRTVVVCSNENEALVVDKALNRSGLWALSYTTKKNATVLLNHWNKQISNEVLICTDADLPKLKFHKVHKLVHFSLPTTWSTFTQRFSVLNDAYHNFIELGLTTDEYVQPDELVSSFIALDSDDRHLLPQLNAFMIKYNQPLPEKLLDYVCQASDPMNVPKDLALASLEPDIISAQSTFKIRWTKLDSLTKVILGDIEDFYNFYVRLTSTKHVEKLATLEKFISEQTFSTPCTTKDLYNTGYYLVSYKNKLARAQLQQSKSSFYRFFLVDLAHFIDIRLDGEKRIKDVYPITRDIIEFTACQSLHCKPAGFEMKPDYSFCNDLYHCEQLYAYPCCQEGQLVNNLHVNSYHIKLFQYKDDADKKKYTFTGDKKALSG